MNTELQKIDAYLASHGFQKKSYLDLSKGSKSRSLVNDSTAEAYCYDDVPTHFLRIKTASADAILLKESLYFIEFKSMLSCNRDAKKYEIIKQNLFIKLGESLLLLNKYLNPSAGVSGNFKKYFIIVVNPIKSPTTALVGSMVGLSKGAYNPTLFHTIFDKYRQCVNGSPTFYDDVMIWNNINFTVEISKLR